MITFLHLMISQYQLLLSQKVTSLCPVIHLVMTQISTSIVPKKHIVMSHDSSQKDLKLTSPVPKITLFSPKICLIMTKSQLLLSQKVTLFCPIFILLWCNFVFSCPKKHLVLSNNLSRCDSISYSPVPKIHLVCPIIRHVLTQYQLLLSQKVTFFLLHHSSCYDLTSSSPAPSSSVIFHHCQDHVFI